MGGPVHPLTHIGVGTTSTGPPDTSPGLAVRKSLALPAHPPRGFPPPPCLSQPAVAKRCPQLQQLRRAPGRPRGHGPLAGLLSSHLPPPAPDQACRCPPAANRAASGRGN